MSKSSYPRTYQTVPTAGNPRRTEAWALTEAARRLNEAAQADPLDPVALLTAARLNWRLWTIFQAEMASPDCMLSVEIRQNMIALCNFVDKATVDLISSPHARKVNVLVNINREIAAGLLASAQNSAAAEQTAQPSPAALDQTS
jgi:flagellar protein FlaF